MTFAAEWMARNRPGWMESHARNRTLAHPCRALQELDPEDLHQTLCDATDHDGKRLLARTDEETFRLHLAFVRAHGIATGDVTTFSNAAVVTTSVERVEPTAICCGSGFSPTSRQASP